MQKNDGLIWELYKNADKGCASNVVIADEVIDQMAAFSIWEIKFWMMGFQIYRNANTGLAESNYEYRLLLKKEGIWNNEKDNEIYIGLCGCHFYYDRCVLGKFCLCVELQNNKGRLVLYEGKSRISKADFELFDDGGSIRSSIWEVTWHEDSVEVILSGDEQFNEQMILYFDGEKERKQLTD